MIIQVDHLALASDNFERDTTFLMRLGYSVAFTEMRAPNPLNKQSLLSRHEPFHDLRLLKKEGSYPIELLNHASSTGKRGFLSSFLPHSLKNDPIFAFGALSENTEKEINALVINRVTAYSHCPADSVAFWQQLGFRLTEECKLAFASPFQKEPLGLEVTPSKQAEAFKLDDTGFNCIALISTSAEKERDRLGRLGFEVTELESFSIHEQNMTLFFVTGPGGELVEIISIAR